MKMFSVHDSKAEAYLQPLFMKTSAEAIRSFETACKDETSTFFQYPADFTLVEIGYFDQNTGSITTLPKPHILANAANYKH